MLLFDLRTMKSFPHASAEFFGTMRPALRDSRDGIAAADAAYADDDAEMSLRDIPSNFESTAGKRDEYISLEI